MQPLIQKFQPVLLAGVLAVSGIACAKETEVVEREIAVPKCAKPVAKVMFTEFKCKAADCNGGSGKGQENPSGSWWWSMGQGAAKQPGYSGLGKGLSDMLATALSQTGCFEVMERAELEEINKELALTGKKVEAESADFMITGSITSLGFDQSATGLGGLALLTNLPILGGLSYKSTKAHLNLDIRMVDIRKAKIVGSKTFEGNNERNGFGFGALGLVPGIGVLGGSHASVSGTPLEEVARDVLVRSTVYVAENLAKKNITEHITVQGKEYKADSDKKSDKD